MDLIKAARADKIAWDSPLSMPLYELPDVIPEGFRWEDIDNLPILNELEWVPPEGPLSLDQRFESQSAQYDDLRGRLVHPVYNLASGPKIDDAAIVIGITSRVIYLQDPSSMRIYQLDKSRTKLLS